MKQISPGVVVIVSLVLGLTLSTLFFLQLKILGSSRQLITNGILESQAKGLAMTALDYAKTYPNNTAVYYLDHITLGDKTQGYLEALPGETGWDLVGRVQGHKGKSEIHWYWEGQGIVDKSFKAKRSRYYQ